MERPIAYDKLAREDRFVRMRARDVAELKVAQGLSPFPSLGSRESMRERVHGILVGELQAMEGAGRTVCDFRHRSKGAPNVHFATDADEPKFVRMLMEILGRTA